MFLVLTDTNSIKNIELGNLLNINEVCHQHHSHEKHTHIFMHLAYWAFFPPSFYNVSDEVH